MVSEVLNEFPNIMTNGIRTLNCLSKESKMPKHQDVDFSSAGEEEFFEDINSPTDNSEDSVEVKVSPISSRNKRKCSEPRKVPDKFTGPLKKRMCLKVQSEKLSEKLGEGAPFRPWSPKVKNQLDIKRETETNFVNVVKIEKPELDIRNIESRFVVPHIPILHPYAYFRPPSPVRFNQEEPVDLIKKCQKTEVVIKTELCSVLPVSATKEVPRVPVHPHVSSLTSAETERLILNSTETFPSLKRPESCLGKREQRNYKNMTRERRIEANARERTRVHTISAAFETLRKSIPSYSHNQKLSKLSVLRIACSYIMTLSNIVKDDDPAKTAEGVDLITKTIQREGKLRKKKDDND
ncbi:hypothetical protein WA026_001576 [Henosepilachna vigintioctopunctata]|uniref:BHLH domain-containing protein n=1 Tax=Henosepilachna vigintioctopunctata TaxID=420089 RepID=A0AAW1UL01_9CUCU